MGNYEQAGTAGAGGGCSMVGGRLHPVAGFRFDVRCLGEEIEHLAGAAPVGAAADVGIRIRHGDALGKHRGHEGIQRHAILTGERLDALPNGIRNGDAQGTHGGGRIRMKSMGVTAETPSEPTPAKSPRLWVMMWEAPEAKAHSNTRSSFGSDRNGRHLK